MKEAIETEGAPNFQVSKHSIRKEKLRGGTPQEKDQMLAEKKRRTDTSRDSKEGEFLKEYGRIISGVREREDTIALCRVA